MHGVNEGGPLGRQDVSRHCRQRQCSARHPGCGASRLINKPLPPPIGPPLSLTCHHLARRAILGAPALIAVWIHVVPTVFAHPHGAWSSASAKTGRARRHRPAPVSSGMNGGRLELRRAAAVAAAAGASVNVSGLQRTSAVDWLRRGLWGGQLWDAWAALWEEARGDPKTQRL